MKTQPTSTTEPNRPPSIEAENAAASARAAWPLRANWKPSSTVAEEEPPGMPMRMEGKVSPVAVGAK